MAQEAPREIVRRAVARDEMDLLLLGEPRYRYFDRWSSSPYNTDAVSLLSAFYGLARDGELTNAKEILMRAIGKLIDCYEGLKPVAGCILFKSSRRGRDAFVLDLPLEELAAELRQNIRVFAFRLEKDKTGLGERFPDGRLGDLRRLSRSCENVGGPAFYV